MKIEFLKVQWYKDFNRHRYEILVECPFFSTVLTVTVQSDWHSTDVLRSQKKKFLLAFMGYPKNYIDPSLTLLKPFLDNRFGNGVTSIIKSELISISALCLKGRKETKNVAPHKIRSNDKEKKND